MSYFINVDDTSCRNDVHGLHKDPSEEMLKILEQRIANISSLLFDGMQVLGIDMDKIHITYNFKEVAANPNIKTVNNRIILEVPCLFLLQAEDLQPSSLFNMYLKRYVQLASSSDKAQQSLAIFSRIFPNYEMTQQAIKFVLYHELAHIALGHDSKQLVHEVTSKKREKQADLISAKYSGAVQGGIYLFKIMSEFYATSSSTHPTYEERIKYLQEYQETSTGLIHQKDCTPLKALTDNECSISSAKLSYNDEQRIP